MPETNEAQELIDTEYKKEYDAMATEAQERLNKDKKWDHAAIRPPTMVRWRASRLRKGGIKSDDAFANLLLDEHDALEAQKE